MELFRMTASRVSELLAKKEISSRDLVKDQFARIALVDDVVQAYVTLCEEKAIAQADLVDAKRANRETLSPLAGIPIGIKDNICVSGVHNTCSSKMLADFVPPYDATVIKKLRDAGAIFTGKLNMDEFAMGSSTETSYFHTTRNPHNLDYVPGGSSGGSAAAVAAGECYGALGTDTGGSIRQPAAFCGVVGLKPTYGRVSRYGAVAFASSLDQVGPLGRTVLDTALLFSEMYGQDPLDATSRHGLPKVTMPKDDLSFLKGLRLGVPREYFDNNVDPIVVEGAKKTLSILKEHGAEIHEVSFSVAQYALPAYYIISCAEASSNLARFDGVRYGYRTQEYQNLTQMYEKSRSEGFGDEVKRRIMLGTFVLSSGYYDAYYKRAKVLQKQIIAQLEQLFETVDMIFTPTVPNTAFRIGAKIEDPVKMSNNDYCTVPANIAGLPAISFPSAKDQHNLPVGAQLIGKPGAEEGLLQVAHCYELLSGSFEEIPALKKESCK